mgnify:CR=1 FL=1|jgi:membrane protein YqaA with SNARE-associated domain
MKFFSWMYAKTMRWSDHPGAIYILAGVSFTEASCFPIPPDILLIPMGLSRPKRAWSLAGLTTVFSVLGGLFGYALGFFLMHLLMPYIVSWGYQASYDQVSQWFARYGFWALLVAGFTPIPYKLFTLSAGAAHLALLPFVVASVIGRGARFYLVSALIYFWGERANGWLYRFVDYLGWAMVVLLVCSYGIYSMVGH